MLVTLQQVKDYLGIIDTDSDTLLTSLLTSADALVKSYTGRDFEEETYTHLFNWKWEYEFLLKQYPVSVLTSFKYNTGSFSSPVWTDFDAESYKLEPENGKIWMMFSLPKWIQNIQAIYTAWYVWYSEWPPIVESEIPAEISQAVIQLTAYYYNWSKSDWIKSENVDWTWVVYDKTIPTNINLILNRYKNVQTF